MIFKINNRSQTVDVKLKKEKEVTKPSCGKLIKREKQNKVRKESQ